MKKFTPPPAFLASLFSREARIAFMLVACFLIRSAVSIAQIVPAGAIPQFSAGSFNASVPSGVVGKSDMLRGSKKQGTPFKISDVTGRVVVIGLEDEASSVDVSRLSPGSYLLQRTDNSNKTESIPFTKE